VVRDGRLGEAGRRCDIARANGAIGREQSHDGQPCRVRERAEEPDVGIVESRHVGHSIDVLLY
jgi:hypothetical protein